MPIGNDVIRANRKYEGQSCAICKREISLGDLIHICPKCQSINHEDCWQNEGGCNSLSCNSLSSGNMRSSNLGSSSNSNSNYGAGYDDSNYGGSPNLGGSSYGNNRAGGFGNNQNSFGSNRNMPTPGASNANMVPCRFCKEPIMRGARKCKHCGEYQNESDRKQATQVYEEGDYSFNIIEGLTIFCCPLVSLIVGSIYCANGRSGKGIRMIKYSIGWMIASFILRVILNIIAAG